MHIGMLKQSRFLTRADVGAGVLVTIKEIYQDNTAKEGAPEELKWVMSFHELDKPMVLNSTNGQIIAQIVGSEETNDWAGHKVVLYDDPNVSFGGKLVGGIRTRAPRNTKPAPAKPGPAARPQAPRQAPIVPVDPGPLAPEEGDESVPF